MAIKLDIILITYNQSQFIEQALEGILLQRLQPSVTARVLVADDASTDDTLKIIRSYEQKAQIPFVYLAKEPNMGHVLNYKRAFEACMGDYVAILEGDDYWCNPYHLQKHLDFLDQHRECVLSSARPCIYDMSKERFSLPEEPRQTTDVWYITAQEEAKGNKILNLSTCVIRRTALDNLNPKLWEVKMLDWLLEIMIAERGLLARHLEQTSVYRKQSNGEWSRLSTEGKKTLMLSQVEEYDQLLERKYTKEFDEVRRFWNNQNRQPLHKRIERWCPPLLISFVRMLIPPILLRK